MFPYYKKSTQLSKVNDIYLEEDMSEGMMEDCVMLLLIVAFFAASFFLPSAAAFMGS